MFVFVTMRKEIGLDYLNDSHVVFDDVVVVAVAVVVAVVVVVGHAGIFCFDI